MSILSAKDKENLVIDLLNKGYVTMEIAKIAHVSFSYIKKVRQKLTGEVNGERRAQRIKPCHFTLVPLSCFWKAKPWLMWPLNWIHQDRRL